MSAFQDFAIHDDQPQAPCLSCEERAPGCHATCRRYRLFRQICRAAAKRRQEQLDSQAAEINRFRRVKGGGWTHRKKR